MKYVEVTPEQDDWERQINITAYYDSITVGSIVYGCEGEGWQSVIDGSIDWLNAVTEKEAKEEMKDKLDSHLESEINYFRELQEMLKELD